MVMRKRDSPRSPYSETDVLQRLQAHVVAASGTRSMKTGTVLLYAEGHLVSASDIRAQARQTLENLMR